MKILKGVAIAAALIAVLAGIVAASVPWLEQRRHARVFEVSPAPVAYVTDPAVQSHGKYLYDSRGCAECHGANGAGRVFVNEPAAGVAIKAPNITPAGVVQRYSERDWVLAIRHGLNPQRQPLFVMPSQDFARMTDADLQAVVAYTRSLPPVKTAEDGARFTLPFMARLMYGLGQMPDAADRIDHRLPPAQPVPVAVSTEHGKYIATMCIGCHGEQLQGGRIPGSPPNWPAASRLAAGEGSVMARYDSQDKFVALLRTGKRPDGTPVAVMPVETLRELNDTDAAALYTYLKSL